METRSIRIVALFLLLLAMTSAASAATIHIVALGDSATAGYLVARKDAYPAQLQAVLRRKGYDVEVRNAGINGGTTLGALHRLDQAIDPDTAIVLVELGTNDLRMRKSMQSIRANLTEIVRTLRKRGIAVLLIGLGRLDLSDVARGNGIPYAQWKLPAGQFRARDGQHFNVEGYRRVIAEMLPQIETLIARSRAK